MDPLETDRLLLRAAVLDDALIYRRLWTERDPRVPLHRRIDADGRPTVDDIAARIRAETDGDGPRLLTVERKGEGDVIGYCGLTSHGHGSADEPELAYELLRRVHGRGYATEAGRAVVTWAGDAGYPRVWAGVRAWNTASRRVLEKLGFREIGQVDPDAAHGDSLLTVRELGATARADGS
jgi:RimJ/RimL family protein N-acetyltransferase